MADWDIVNGGLHKEWAYETFAEAWAAAEKIAKLAEMHNHHPDITVGWGKLVLGGLCTHDAGNVITEKDHAFAEAVDKLGL
ncbi:MAG: 4a-hydroxytetrahydrobiopterin dehydratase [Alphaproteobacteria bacterium]|nr:4a-hydroxytetrahydrobiopterin dehydratase [Alphaproteobacteria bacterium]MDD9919222.1 4a-hydroxytetrahydrobiopterin dehydratase [Alphaproteobacteria bacterium]